MSNSNATGPPQKFTANKRKVLPWLALGLLMALSLWLRWRYAWVQGFHYDEGHWMMFALLVNAGHPAYSETFVGIPPLALLIIQAGAALFGSTLSARYPMMLVSLVGVGSIFWWFQPTKSSIGLMAGLLAGTLLSFAPLYFNESVSIMAEAPAVSLAVLSLILAQQYYFKEKNYWLFLSGLVFAFSLALKIFVIFLPAIIGTFILLAVARNKPESNWLFIRRLLICGGNWLLGFSLPVVIIAIAYETQAMYQQVVAFRFAIRQATLANFSGNFLLENIEVLTRYTVDHSLLFVGAVLGATIGWKKRFPDVIIWSVWLILGILMLVWHVPLRNRYFIVLLPGLAALSSLFWAYVLQWISSMFSANRPVHWAGGMMGTLVIVVVLITFQVTKLDFSPTAAWSPNYSYHFEDFSVDRNNALDYIEQNTSENDCIVTDDQRVAIATNRMVPPKLSETSYARLLTGWMLDLDGIIHEVNANDCSIVMYATKRFHNGMPGLSDQLRKLYFLEIIYNDRTSVYSIKRNLTQKPDIPFDVQLGEQITLKGVDLTPTPWYPEQKIKLATYWNVTKSPNQAYKIFVHLRNSRNETLARYDHFPFPVPGYRYQFVGSSNKNSYKIVPHINNLQTSPEDIINYPKKGMLPTNAWPENSTIREVYTLSLPETLPLGTYYVFIGMYNPDTLVRLPVLDDGKKSDEFLLALVEVKDVD